MKKIFNISILTIAVSFLFTGCYTIVWDPNMEFPNEETYNYNEDSEFYDYEDYGGYVDYYESPWWVTPVVYITTTNENGDNVCLLYTSPSPRDRTRYRMPSSA